METRFAKNSDISSLKQIWSLCFKDEDSYIDFYYDNRFKPDETLLLTRSDTAAAMLSIFPVKLYIPSFGELDSSMLYAIATHPDSQGAGLASKLINSCNVRLKENNVSFSVLVPANTSLFAFYYRLGYMDGFYIRQCVLSHSQINSFSYDLTSAFRHFPVDANSYNNIRNDFLKDHVFIKYSNEDIAYQKKLCNVSKSDIYIINIDDIYGCAVIERLSENKIFIKELLIPEKYLKGAVKYISNQFSANEYIIRTPAFLGSSLGDGVIPFAVYKSLTDEQIDLALYNMPYLALAFD